MLVLAQTMEGFPDVKWAVLKVAVVVLGAVLAIVYLHWKMWSIQKRHEEPGVRGFEVQPTKQNERNGG